VSSCLVCGREPAHSHHTLPKSVWPQHRDNPSCLVPLCFVCHDAWHRCYGNVPWDMLPLVTQRLISVSADTRWIERWYPQRAFAVLPF
jgi:hypothetical protein